MGGSPSSSRRTPSRSRAQLRRQQLTEGTLVQRLVRSTGDPADRARRSLRRAHDPEGERAERARRVEDRGRTRHARRSSTRQPAAPRSGGRARSLFYPPAKKVVATLVASDGYPYETPRWFADNQPTARHAQHARAATAPSVPISSSGAPRTAASRASRGERRCATPIPRADGRLGRRGALRARLVRSRSRRSRHARGARAPRRKRDAQLLPPARLAGRPARSSSPSSSAIAGASRACRRSPASSATPTRTTA